MGGLRLALGAIEDVGMLRFFSEVRSLHMCVSDNADHVSPLGGADRENEVVVAMLRQVCEVCHLCDFDTDLLPNFVAENPPL